MKLKYVDMKNFRSISDLRIDFNINCKILVGKNESGKSNIIKALSMLSPESSLTASDKRQPLPSEPIPTLSNVRHVFELDEDELNILITEIKKEIYIDDYDKKVFKNDKGKTFTLEEFVRAEKKQIVYISNIITATKLALSWAISEGAFELIGDWKKPVSPFTDNVTLIDKDNETINLKGYSAILGESCDNLPATTITQATFKNVVEIIDKCKNKMLTDDIPTVICWNYNEKNLLPANIDLTQFISDPNTCVPLKQMFNLAGIYNIKKSIETEKAVSEHRYRNLLNRVAETTTNHFREVWSEYKSISFSLLPNGNYIDASIKDEFNHYEFTERSDGFKRFVTFLLLISSRVKIGFLENALILIDEPDICLHPSGARYLRDELINISEKNIVVYSTHSIFMIDDKEINRHLIVTKNDEKTVVKEVNSSNIVDEEVIYNALGYSIFESLKQKNIIFEGWKDKKLFETALIKPPKDYKELKLKYNNIGLCHARGVKDIQNITPLLQLANRDCVILSDNDNPAKEKQKEYQKNKYHGKWYRYSDISSDISAVTGEDFLSINYVKESIIKLNNKYPELVGLAFDPMPQDNKLGYLQKGFKSFGIKDDTSKKILDDLKNYLFEHIKPLSIDESYYKLLVALAEKVAKN